MKRFNFLPVAIALVLIVTTVSCTTMAGSQDDYYENRSSRAYGDRVYVEDPYRGTVVLERDPRTGRYYEVDSYYNGYYGNRYSSRAYGYPSSGYGRSPYYGRTNGGYRNNSTATQNNTQRQSDNDRQTREEARKKVLGRQ
jgi:hypothetical protein